MADPVPLFLHEVVDIVGRGGRAYLRYATGTDDLAMVAVNDVADPTMIARQLRREISERYRHQVNGRAP